MTSWDFICWPFGWYRFGDFFCENWRKTPSLYLPLFDLNKNESTVARTGVMRGSKNLWKPISGPNRIILGTFLNSRYFGVILARARIFIKIEYRHCLYIFSADSKRLSLFWTLIKIRSFLIAVGGRADVWSAYADLLPKADGSGSFAEHGRKFIEEVTG